MVTTKEKKCMSPSLESCQVCDKLWSTGGRSGHDPGFRRPRDDHSLLEGTELGQSSPMWDKRPCGTEKGQGEPRLCRLNPQPPSSWKTSQIRPEKSPHTHRLARNKSCLCFYLLGSDFLMQLTNPSSLGNRKTNRSKQCNLVSAKGTEG